MTMKAMNTCSILSVIWIMQTKTQDTSKLPLEQLKLKILITVCIGKYMEH